MKAINYIYEARALLAEFNESGEIKEASKDTDVLEIDTNALQFLNASLREFRTDMGVISELTINTATATQTSGYYVIDLPTDWDTYDSDTTNGYMSFDIKGRKMYIPTSDGSVNAIVFYTPTPQYITNTETEITCYNEDTKNAIIEQIALKLSITMRSELSDVLNMFTNQSKNQPRPAIEGVI